MKSHRPSVSAPSEKIDGEVLKKSRRIHGIIEPGTTIFGELLKSGVDEGYAISIIKSFGGVLDLRYIKPGETYTITFNTEGELISFEYITDTSDIFFVENKNGRLLSGKRVAVLKKKHTLLCGIVNSSIEDAVVFAGGYQRIARDFVDLLAWDIDFFIQSNSKDAFIILVEELFKKEETGNLTRETEKRRNGETENSVRAIHEPRSFVKGRGELPLLRNPKPVPLIDSGAGSGQVQESEIRNPKEEFVSFNRIIAARYLNGQREHTIFYYKDPRGNGDYYTYNGKRLKRPFLRAPLKYDFVSRGYTDWRFNTRMRFHKPYPAISYAAPEGKEVISIADGEVIRKTFSEDSGNTIEIRHIDGFVSGYYHLKGFFKGIKEGVPVKQGEVIGYVGSTGEVSRPHLQFALKEDGVYVDPTNTDFPEGESIQKKYMKDFRKKRDLLLKELNKLNKPNEPATLNLEP